MKKALIVCKGFPPSKSLLRMEVASADFVIAADGGAHVLLEHDIQPDVVTGDMDSFKPAESVNFEILADPDQDTNDLEKALKLAMNRQFQSVVVLGAFGRRMDHSLKNLSVLKQFNAVFSELIFKDDHQRCVCIGEGNKLEGREEPGTVVSLFPLSGKVEGITTKGLKYALENETLENGVRDGTSNENTEAEFSITVQSGDLVVFIGR